MNRFRSKRAWLFIAAAVLYVAATMGVSVVRSLAQDASADSTAWRVKARSSSLREIDGEKVIVLEYDTIYHRDVVITSDRGEYYGDQLLALFTGHVVITQKTMIMFGDRGEYDRGTGLATLRENVRIVDEGWEVTCEEARFNRDSGEAWLIGNVVAKDSATTMHADRLLYKRETGEAEAFGRVTVMSEDQGFQVTGRHGFYFRDSGQGVIDREPHLIVDPDSPDPVHVDSDTMRVYPDSGLALAYYTVKIIKGSTVTQADSAAIYEEDQRAELYGSPLAKQENASMSGDRMALFYNDNEVERIDISGDAVLLEEYGDSLVTERDNWIHGDTMSLFLSDNRIDSILVSGNARSEYHPSTPGKVESNFVSGDEMFFLFDTDSLAYVKVSGNSSGTYRYVDLEDGQTTDSLRAVADTTLEYLSFEEKAEDVVYSARSLEYYATTRDLVLDSTAKIRYLDNTLTGEDIIYYSDLDLLDATGEPILTEGNQKFYGSRMNYDLVKQTGLVRTGSTRFQEGFYTGEHVAKVGDNEMKVWRSVYTTCDLAEPHFHFRSKIMKVYQNDKVFTGPVWLYVGQTPVFYLPFMANTIQRGRRSGFLRPDFDVGVTSSSGRFIRNLGYYWATSDYTDFLFRFDFNEDSDMLGEVFNQYRVRYKFNGSIRYKYLRNLRTFLNEWTVDAAHNQTFFRDYKLSANLRFVSSDLAPSSVNRIDNVDRYVDRQIRSTARLSKTWSGVGFSVNGTRTQNLNVVERTSDKISMDFPNVALSIPSRNLFFGDPSREGKEGVWEKILSNTTFSPSLAGNRTWKESDARFEEIINVRSGLSLGSPQRIGFITVQPRISANNTMKFTDLETFENTVIESIDTTATPPDTVFVDDPPYSRETDTENDFRWSTGVTTNTNIYGTFYTRLGVLRGVRHRVTPSASYSFQPRVGDSPANHAISLGLQNSIDLKVVSGRKQEGRKQGGGTADERVPTPGGGRRAGGDVMAEGGQEGEAEEELRKIDNAVLWSLSTSVDPDNGLRQWGNISSRINTAVYGMNISLNQTYDPYARDITNTSATSQFRLGGSHPFGISNDLDVRALNVVARQDTAGQDTTGTTAYFEETGDRLGDEQRGELELREGYLPWSVSMNLSYSKSGESEPRSTLNLSASLDLTDSWNISYGGSYNFNDRELAGQRISVQRDLHCWQMSLARQKLGDEWQFYFRISLIAHPDLYGEQGLRGLGGGGGALGGSFLR